MSEMIKVKISAEMYDEVTRRMDSGYSDACEEFIEIVWDAKIPTRKTPTIVEVSVEQFDAFVKEIAQTMIEFNKSEIFSLNADVWYTKSDLATMRRQIDRIAKTIADCEKVKK